jgi:hypothetical protein
MYLWRLVSHHTAEGTVLTGTGDDLVVIMRAAESSLLQRGAFLCVITAVVPRVSVFHLGEIYVPTGREWYGRRNTVGGIHWKARFRSVDPGVAYTLAAGHDVTAFAG